MQSNSSNFKTSTERLNFHLEFTNKTTVNEVIFIGRAHATFIGNLQERFLQTSASVQTLITTLYQYFPELSLAEEDLKRYKLHVYSAFNALPDDNDGSMRCYAVPEFHELPRYDTIQISDESALKWFAKLVLIFRINLSGVQHNLALVQQYDFVDPEQPLLLKLPHVTLTQNYQLIPLNAVDQRMVVHPIYTESNHFLLDSKY